LTKRDEIFFSLYTAGCEVRISETLRCHTSIRIGGDVEYFVVPFTAESLVAAVEILEDAGLKWRVLGAGTNILASDEETCAVISTKHLTGIWFTEKGVIAEAGVIVDRLIELAILKGLSGLEFASGLPGTLGGAVTMNAGAFGGEMAGLVQSAECLMPDMRTVKLDRNEMQFGYRTSAFRRAGAVILRVSLKMTKNDISSIKARRREILNCRILKQPLQLPSAGSVFIRPMADFYVGSKIEGLGFKGYRVGDAEVSTKHAGFIVNKGNASQRDVLILIEKLRKAVYEDTGHWLQTELDIW